MNLHKFKDYSKILDIINKSIKIKDVSKIIIKYIETNIIYKVELESIYYNNHLIGIYSSVDNAIVNLLLESVRHENNGQNLGKYDYRNDIWIFDTRIFKNKLHFKIEILELNYHYINFHSKCNHILYNDIFNIYDYCSIDAEEATKIRNIVQKYYDSFKNNFDVFGVNNTI